MTAKQVKEISESEGDVLIIASDLVKLTNEKKVESLNVLVPMLNEVQSGMVRKIRGASDTMGMKIQVKTIVVLE